MSGTEIVPSPNAPRPGDPLTVEIAGMLRCIELSYAREGSGPGSRFAGRLLEDVQAERVLREVRQAIRTQTASEFYCAVRNLMADYGDSKRDVIATVPFAASLLQLAIERYGLTDEEMGHDG